MAEEPNSRRAFPPLIFAITPRLSAYCLPQQGAYVNVSLPLPVILVWPHLHVLTLRLSAEHLHEQHPSRWD